MSPVKYELGLYIKEHDILHSHSRENVESYIDTLVHNGVDWNKSCPVKKKQTCIEIILY
jgi:hypothetical protein